MVLCVGIPLGDNVVVWNSEDDIEHVCLTWKPNGVCVCGGVCACVCVCGGGGGGRVGVLNGSICAVLYNTLILNH